MNNQSSAPPPSFELQPATSTNNLSNRMVKWMNKWLITDPSPVDPRSNIKGIRKLSGGIKEFINLGSSLMSKYISTYIRY